MPNLIFSIVVGRGTEEKRDPLMNWNKHYIHLGKIILGLTHNLTAMLLFNTVMVSKREFISKKN